ncbi:hypothetical protein [Methylobacterium sp. ID0610]|uniref:hypothetical protein n=1 Tax=Methylobacterium carpenticola TaxID=3344827 RepID=UPI003680AFAE
MDDILALLGEVTTDSEPTSAAGESRHTFPAQECITLFKADYWRNPENKGSWMRSKEAVTMPFFMLTERFKPHHSIATVSPTAQMHDPDFVSNYIRPRASSRRD